MSLGANVPVTEAHSFLESFVRWREGTFIDIVKVVGVLGIRKQEMKERDCGDT